MSNSDISEAQVDYLCNLDDIDKDIDIDFKQTGDDTLSARSCPILQDIDGDISKILQRLDLSDDEIQNELIKKIDIETLKQIRTDLFRQAKGLYYEQFDTPPTTPLHIAPRRGITAQKMRVLDIIFLFRYLSGIDDIFPTSVLKTTKNGDIALKSDDKPDESPVTKHTNAARVPETVDEENMTPEVCRELIVQNFEYGQTLLVMRGLIDNMEAEITKIKEKLDCKSQIQCCPCNCKCPSISQILSHPSPDAVSTHTHPPTTPSPPPEAPRVHTVPPQSAQTAPSNRQQSETSPLSPESCNKAISELLYDVFSPTKPTLPIISNTSSTNSAPVIHPASPDYKPPTETYNPNSRENVEYIIRCEMEHYERTVLALDDRVSRNETAISEISEFLTFNQVRHGAGLTGAESCIPNVPTHNPFSPLIGLDENASPTHDTCALPTAHSSSAQDTKGSPSAPLNREASVPPAPAHGPSIPVPKPRKAHVPSQPVPKPRKSRPKPSTKVKIVGSSLVRDMGEHVNSPKVYGSSFPFPGYKAEEIAERLPGVLSDSDDLVVIFGGTNNIPSDTVATCIYHIDGLVSKAIKLRPNKPILLSEIPARFDGDYSDKIKHVNDYLDHLTKKYENLYLLGHDLSRTDLNRGGLHFSKQGKSRIGERIRDIAIKIV